MSPKPLWPVEAWAHKTSEGVVSAPRCYNRSFPVSWESHRCSIGLISGKSGSRINASWCQEDQSDRAFSVVAAWCICKYLYYHHKNKRFRTGRFSRIIVKNTGGVNRNIENCNCSRNSSNILFEKR